MPLADAVWRPCHAPRDRRGRSPGQALVLLALILAFLALLLITAVEIGGRTLQRAALEDALRQATRSAVQSFAYAEFAHNTQALQSTADCSGTLAAGCAGNAVAAQARPLFELNLGTAPGLRAGETAATVAQQVVWTIGATGGSCQGRSYTTPIVCAELDAPMQSLVGRFGSWTPRIAAAETLDRFATD